MTAKKGKPKPQQTKRVTTSLSQPSVRDISRTSQFKRDWKRMRKRGKSIEKLKKVVYLLEQGQPLPDAYKDHPLQGNWVDSRDCHIEPDWVLIYTLVDGAEVRLERTGSHSDLFQ